MLRLILILSIIGIIYSIYSIITYINEYRISEKKYEELKVIYDENEANQDQELKRLNGDYAGWLTVDGSEINYPVVHGEDNDFYLTHNFYKEEDKVGAIFMDYRNLDDDLEPHKIIYGHNMKDNSMFGSLSNVLESDFSKDNHIKLDFQNQTYEWEIFSAYVTRETDWMQIDFESTDRYSSFIRDLKNKSNVNFSNELKKDDKILTLATCTSHVSDERVVVHARLLKGE